jgi:triacylglycerol lipase
MQPAHLLPCSLALLLLFACQGPLALQPPAPGAVTAARLSTTAVNSQLHRLRQQQFQELDHNHNGSLESQEVPHLSTATFQQYDRDQNQQLSLAELYPQAPNQPTPGLLRKELEILYRQVQQGQARQEKFPDLPNPNQSYAAFEQAFLREVSESAFVKQTATPSQYRTPVLLVPGYAEPSWYFMYGLYRMLKKEGWAVEGINLFPNFASAEEQAAKVKAKVAEMQKTYGSSKVHLVVHSFGGLISRYYIQALEGQGAVDQLITIATPHFGTYTAYLGPGKSAEQLRPNSPFIQQLNAQGFIHPPVRYTSIWSNVDEIVIPPRHAIMPGAPTHEVSWTGHLSIMFSERTYTHVKTALKSSP